MTQYRLKRVWLTFGDGPSPWTPQIQDVLEEQGVRATFFMCGKRARHTPDLVRRAAQSGHRIGSHAWSHRRLTSLPSSEVEEELRATNALLEDIIGAPIEHFLAPFCDSDERIQQIARQLGMHSLECEGAIDPRDWEEPGADELVRRVRVAMREETWGSERLVFLHDGKADDLPFTTEICDEDRLQTVRALPRIIESFRERDVAMDLL
jgi:peptidoglycan/xylan/chitin deacetylase (PgdA/CDA1 family)